MVGTTLTQDRHRIGLNIDFDQLWRRVSVCCRRPYSIAAVLRLHSVGVTTIALGVACAALRQLEHIRSRLLSTFCTEPFVITVLPVREVLFVTECEIFETANVVIAANVGSARASAIGMVVQSQPCSRESGYYWQNRS